MLVTFFQTNHISGLPLWAYCNVIDSCCREIICLRGKYRTTSEAINKSTIIAIKLLILRSFQRKGLCNSGLKA